MIVQGVLWSPELCLYAPGLRTLAEGHFRRDGRGVPPELAEVLGEMVEVGEQYRTRYAAHTESGTPGTMEGEVGAEALAARLGVTESYVRRLARTGVLPGRRVGAAWVFGTDAIEAFERRRAS